MGKPGERQVAGWGQGDPFPHDVLHFPEWLDAAVHAIAFSTCELFEMLLIAYSEIISRSECAAEYNKESNSLSGMIGEINAHAEPARDLPLYWKD